MVGDLTKTTKGKKKCQGLLQLFQRGDHKISDAHQAHTALMDTSKIKGCVEGHSHGSRITQYNHKTNLMLLPQEYISHIKKVQMCTEKSSDTQKKDRVNLEDSRNAN